MRRKAIPAEETGLLKRPDWIWIGCAWLALQLLLFLRTGIYDQEEALKYIHLASRWMNGDRDIPLYNFFYSGYVAILVILKSVGLPFKSMYVVQLVFSALAIYYYAKIITTFLQSRIAVFIAVLLYATCYIIQSWVSMLFTDSLFSSLLIMAIYFLLNEHKSSGSKWIYWILLLLLPVFRPVGFLFIVVSGFYWLMLSPRQNAVKLLVATAYALLIGMVVYKTFEISEPYYYPIHSLHNIQANVICGNQENFLGYQKVPYGPGMSVFSYLLHNPGMTSRLFIARFYKVFSMGRSYFSPLHNGILFVSTFIYYFLAIMGVVSIWRDKKKKLYFLIAGALVFAFPLVIFCVEWSGRFSLPVICFVLLTGSVGLEKIVQYGSAWRRK